MIEKPCFTRDIDHLYCLQPHQEYWFVTGISPERQAIWGFLGNSVVGVFFSLAGDFLGMNAFTQFATPSSLGAQDLAFSEVNSFFKKEMEMELAPISVKRFWIDGEAVGIEDVDGLAKELLTDSDALDEDEKIDAAESLKWWSESGSFVFWWEQSFYVDRTGEVSAS